MGIKFNKYFNDVELNEIEKYFLKTFDYKCGDHLIHDMPLVAKHHGIYIGDGKVIHFAETSNLLGINKIHTASIANFVNGQTVEEVKKNLKEIKTENHYVGAGSSSSYSKEDVVKRALETEKIHDKPYCLLNHNCEHFATWCVKGSETSDQSIVTGSIAVAGVATFFMGPVGWAARAALWAFSSAAVAATCGEGKKTDKFGETF